MLLVPIVELLQGVLKNTRLGRLKAILRVLNANLGTCNFAHIMQICVHNANLCAMQICERAIYMRAILRTMQFCAYINFIHVYVCVYVCTYVRMRVRVRVRARYYSYMREV